MAKAPFKNFGKLDPTAFGQKHFIVYIFHLTKKYRIYTLHDSRCYRIFASKSVWCKYI